MATKLPQTIHALLQPDFKVAKLVRTRLPLQLPKEGSDEHLIRVHTFAPCAHELTWAPDFPGTFVPDRVNVPGFDLAGTVVSAPIGSQFQPGAQVYAAGGFEHSGSAREYTVIGQRALATKPATLSWKEAASVPISATTAWQALFDHLRLARGWESAEARMRNAGKRLLVTAAAGGVGVWALQLARAAGVLDIVAVCGPRNADYVRALGATAVLDYTTQSIGEWARDPRNARADAILDMVGGQTCADCWSALKDNSSMLVSVHSPPEPSRPAERHPEQGRFFIFEPRADELAEITKLLDAGSVKPIVDSVYGFDKWQDAWDRVDTGHARGKVIVSFDDDGA